MMEFTLNNGPQDMVLCTVEWDCKTCKIENDATKVRITRRCQEVETSRTEEDNRNEEVECFKQKLLEAEKKIQFFEQKLEEADRTCLEQKLEESEKACLELRRRVTYIEDEKKSLKQNVIEMKKLLLESEDLRKDLHNQMMALNGNMRVFCRVRPLAAKDNPNDQKLIIFPESLEYSGCGLQVVHNVDPCRRRAIAAVLSCNGETPVPFNLSSDTDVWVIKFISPEFIIFCTKRGIPNSSATRLLYFSAAQRAIS